MKFLSNMRASLRKNNLKNQKGQGATEYILLLVVVVGLVIAFGPKIKKMVSDKTGALETDMGQITN
ncbi:MAG: hypothetical protein WA160_05205 [Pseudobdellovibrio sp.]